MHRFCRQETGLIIDYVGIFDRVDKAFEIYTKEDLAGVILDINKMAKDFEETLNKLLELFEGIPKDYKKPTLQKTLEVITSDKKTEDDFISDYNLLRRLYEFLGSDEVKLDNLDNYKWLTGVYTNYIKIVKKDEKYQEYLEKYFKKTLNLIHQESSVEELISSNVEKVIDENYMREISGSEDDENKKASDLIFTLNKFVLVDKHKNPVYESLIEKVESLVKRWRERIQKGENVSNEFLEAKEISNEIIEIQENKKLLNLTDEQMSVWLTIKNVLDIEMDKELLDSLKDLFIELKPEMIPGWTKNTELRKSIETKIRQFLFLKVKSKYPVTLEKINEIHSGISEKMVSYGT